MEEKLRFVFEYERDEQTMRELCRQFEISRETGYVWLRRYRQHGAEGLLELNRAPERHPNQTAAEIEEAVTHDQAATGFHKEIHPIPCDQRIAAH